MESDFSLFMSKTLDPSLFISPRGETAASDFSRRHKILRLVSRCSASNRGKSVIIYVMPRVSVVDQVRCWKRNQSARRVRRTSKRSIVRSSVRNRRIRRGGIDQRSAIGLTSSSGRYTLLEAVDTLNSSNRVLGYRESSPSSSSNARFRPRLSMTTEKPANK